MFRGNRKDGFGLRRRLGYDYQSTLGKSSRSFFALTSCFRARRPRAARQRVSVGSFPSLGLSGVRRDGGPDTLLLAAHTIDGGLRCPGFWTDSGGCARAIQEVACHVRL